MNPFRTLLCLPGAMAVVVVMVGCSHAPPADAFDDGVASGGIASPIRYVTTGMPDDAPAEGAAEMLTLEDAVRRALATDPAIQAAIARTRAALADAKQARLLPNPILNVAFRFPEGGGKPIIEAGLGADLVSILLQPRQVSAADARLRAASSAALTVVLNAIADVQERYVSVQALDAQLITLEERRRLLEKLLNVAQARVQAGESTRLDAITLDSERASLEVEIIQANLGLREQRLELTRLIGEPSGAATWTLPAWTSPELVPMTESAWLKIALDRRPELQGRRWELAALGDDLAIAKFAVLDNGNVGVDAERDGNWSVGPAVTTPIPLLDWGQARRARVEAQRVEARHLYTQSRRQVIEETRRALESLHASQAALDKVQRELIPLADQRREQAESSYKGGFADVTAVLLAEQEAQGARSKLIELQSKVSSAHFRLQRAAGGAIAIPDAATTTQATSRRTSEER